MPMRSQFTIDEVGEMLNLNRREVEEEITNGHLTYTHSDGKRVITLYDLEKYMGSEIAMNIAMEYIRNQKEAKPQT